MRMGTERGAVTILLQLPQTNDAETIESSFTAPVVLPLVLA